MNWFEVGTAYVVDARVATAAVIWSIVLLCAMFDGWRTGQVRTGYKFDSIVDRATDPKGFRSQMIFLALFMIGTLLIGFGVVGFAKLPGLIRIFPTT